MLKLTVDVWSDIACPWCYVGKRRLAAALEQLCDGGPDRPRRGEIAVTWRSFELDPGAPRSFPPDPPFAARLARKYGSSLADAEAMIARMTEVGAADGLELHFEKLRPGNTFDAHRLLHLARTVDLEDALAERLFSAYLRDGLAIGEPAVLADLAVEVGLDRADVERLLISDSFAAAVREDEHLARQIGIRGVPFFVFGERHTVSGAQPVAALVSALQTALAELSNETLVEGMVCGPDGCA